MKRTLYAALIVLGLSTVYAQSNTSTDLKEQYTAEKTKDATGLDALKNYLKTCVKDTAGISKANEFGYPHSSTIAYRILRTLDHKITPPQDPLDSLEIDITATAIQRELTKYKVAWQETPQNVKKTSAHLSLLKKQIQLSRIYQGSLETYVKSLYITLGIKQ